MDLREKLTAREQEIATLRESLRLCTLERNETAHPEPDGLVSLIDMCFCGHHMSAHMCDPLAFLGQRAEEQRAAVIDLLNAGRCLASTGGEGVYGPVCSCEMFQAVGRTAAHPEPPPIDPARDVIGECRCATNGCAASVKTTGERCAMHTRAWASVLDDVHSSAVDADLGDSSC